MRRDKIFKLFTFITLRRERRGKLLGFMGIMLLAVGLSMDSSAISACKGLAMPKVNYRHVAVIALSFGGAEGILALLGWLLGRQFYNTIVHFDHWIVLILLTFIGGKMIWDAFHTKIWRPKNAGAASAFGKRFSSPLSPPSTRWPQASLSPLSACRSPQPSPLLPLPRPACRSFT